MRHFLAALGVVIKISPILPVTCVILLRILIQPLLLLSATRILLWSRCIIRAFKEGGTDTFNEYIAEINTKAFSWDKLIYQYKKVFGRFRINVFLFEDFVQDNLAVVNAFFKIFDDRLEVNIEEVVVENPSVSAKGLEILRRCNPLLEQDKQKQINFRYYIQKEFPKLFNQPSQGQIISNFTKNFPGFQSVLLASF